MMDKDLKQQAEEKRQAITDLFNNPDNWERIRPPKVKPALAKKYNMDSGDLKKFDKRIGENLLSSFEHSVLGTTTIGWVPLNALYKDALNEFVDVTFESFVGVLVNLFNLGYIECQVDETPKRPVSKLVKKALLKYYSGDLSQEEINIYPKVLLHEFRATRKGKKEEAKEAYNVYYSDKG